MAASMILLLFPLALFLLGSHHSDSLRVRTSVPIRFQSYSSSSSFSTSALFSGSKRTFVTNTGMPQNIPQKTPQKNGNNGNTDASSGNINGGKSARDVSRGRRKSGPSPRNRKGMPIAYSSPYQSSPSSQSSSSITKEGEEEVVTAGRVSVYCLGAGLDLQALRNHLARKKIMANFETATNINSNNNSNSNNSDDSDNSDRTNNDSNSNTDSKDTDNRQTTTATATTTSSSSSYSSNGRLINHSSAEDFFHDEVLHVSNGPVNVRENVRENMRENVERTEERIEESKKERGEDTIKNKVDDRVKERIEENVEERIDSVVMVVSECLESEVKEREAKAKGVKGKEMKGGNAETENGEKGGNNDGDKELSMETGIKTEIKIERETETNFELIREPPAAVETKITSEEVEEIVSEDVYSQEILPKEILSEAKIEEMLSNEPKGILPTEIVTKAVLSKQDEHEDKTSPIFPKEPKEVLSKEIAKEIYSKESKVMFSKQDEDEISPKDIYSKELSSKGVISIAPKVTFSKQDEDELSDSQWKVREQLLLATQDTFYFDYGCVVFWGMTVSEERAAISELGTFVIEPVSTGQQDMSYDTLEYVFDRRKVNHIKPIRFDRIRLRSLQLSEKMALSYAMAQSSKLFVFESRVLESVEKTRYLPRELAENGRINSSKKALNQQIGALFVEQTEVNLFSSILDSPDFLWNDDEHLPAYQYIRAYLEVDNRVALLNSRLAVIRDLLDVLTAQVADSNSTRLEWIVIWLISVEIVMGMASNPLFAGKRVLMSLLVPVCIIAYKRINWSKVLKDF